MIGDTDACPGIEVQRLVTDLLWKTGLMAKVKVATYDVTFENL